jgi:very-short-patch-repair endonuclease
MAKDATQAKIDEIFEESKASIIDDLEHDFALGLSSCESPIERLFMAALLNPDTIRQFDITTRSIMRPPSRLIAHASPPPMVGLYIYPQIIIGDYRVDFYLSLVEHDKHHALIVECDGHDFHEKTKEQARRDKARDRYLVGQGYRLIRFTGAEIFADPIGTAYESLTVLQDLRL